MLFIFMLCLCLFHFLVCIMHSAFNLFVFPNYMFTSLLLFLLLCFYFFIYFLWKGCELSGEIALKNNHYYYYYNLPTSITIGNAQVHFKESVKNLGFTIDCRLTINAHVSNIARSSYFELRRFAFIRRFLTSTATAALVSAFAYSRIDYCNSLMFGSTLDVTSYLQQIQNYATRVVFHLKKSSNITTHHHFFVFLSM